MHLHLKTDLDKILNLGFKSLSDIEPILQLSSFHVHLRFGIEVCKFTANNLTNTFLIKDKKQVLLFIEKIENHTNEIIAFGNSSVSFTELQDIAYELNKENHHNYVYSLQTILNVLRNGEYYHNSNAFMLRCMVKESIEFIMTSSQSAKADLESSFLDILRNSLFESLSEEEKQNWLLIAAL